MLGWTYNISGLVFLVSIAVGIGSSILAALLVSRKAANINPIDVIN